MEGRCNGDDFGITEARYELPDLQTAMTIESRRNIHAFPIEIVDSSTRLLAVLTISTNLI